MSEKIWAILKFYAVQLAVLAVLATISLAIHSYAMGNFEKAEMRQAEGFRAWAGENLRLPEDAHFETKFPDDSVYYDNARSEIEWGKGLLSFTALASYQLRNKSLYIEMYFAPSGKAWSDVFAAAYATDNPNLTRVNELAKDAMATIISEPNALRAIEGGNVTYLTAYNYLGPNRTPFLYALQAEPGGNNGLSGVTVVFNSAEAPSYLWRKIEGESAKAMEVKWAYRLDMMDNRYNGVDAWKEIDKYTRLIDTSPITVFGRDFGGGGKEMKLLFVFIYFLAFITSAIAFLAVLPAYLRKREKIPFRSYIAFSAAFIVSTLLLKSAYFLAYFMLLSSQLS